MPHIENEDEDEEEESDEDDEIRSVKCIEHHNNTVMENNNHSHNHQVIKLTDSVPLAEQKQFVAVKDEKSANKKSTKKTRCHILCLFILLLKL